MRPKQVFRLTHNSKKTAPRSQRGIGQRFFLTMANGSSRRNRCCPLVAIARCCLTHWPTMHVWFGGPTNRFQVPLNSQKIVAQPNVVYSSHEQIRQQLNGTETNEPNKSHTHTQSVTMYNKSVTWLIVCIKCALRLGFHCGSENSRIETFGP